MDPVPDVDALTWLFGVEPASTVEDDWRKYWHLRLKPSPWMVWRVEA